MSNDNKELKNNEELNAEKRELTQEELEQVTGGLAPHVEPVIRVPHYEKENLDRGVSAPL